MAPCSGKRNRKRNCRPRVLRLALVFPLAFLTIAFILVRPGSLVFASATATTTGSAKASPGPTAVVPESILVPPPAPPTSVEAFDSPSDQGGMMTIHWTKSVDDIPITGRVRGYVIARSEAPDGKFEPVSTVALQIEEYLDTSVQDQVPYYYKVAAIGDGEVLSFSGVVGPAVSKQQWFSTRKANLLVISLIIAVAILLYVYQAKAGKKLYIRRIAGIEAVEEAVGRATEMGKPILFIPGIQDMDNVQTVAGLSILASVGKLAAQYETKLDVPVSRSLVMSTARETLKQAYLSVGRPDLYNDDSVYYITDEQFGYVAAVDGIMVREKPAACFYMGAFFAESLILAETGNSIGAIQIAGTAMPTQLPFFVAACDYTLIGEELFAASAYLSKDERMIGSLKGQDVGKGIAMFFIILGTLVATVGALTENGTVVGISDWLKNLFSLNF
ncbi:MAG: hypothetical protein NTX17_01300 [Candidatus Eisenbacteria bacterium]|nr:hypothetical protein [Candidatus Eisenbacteria bacterium]